MTNLDEPHIWSNDPDSIDNLSFLCKGRHIWYNQDDVNHTGSASERMTLLANGNLGIGTTSPSYPLTVRQEDYNNDGTAEDIPERTPQLVIETDGYKGAIEFRSKWSSYNYSGAMIYTTKDGTYDTNLHLMAAQDSSYPSVPGITIDSYNNVGIGTTSPAALLDIQAPAGDQKLLRLGNERLVFQSIRSNPSDPAYSHLRLTSSTSAKWFYIDLDTNLDGVHSSGEGDPIFGVYTHASDDEVYVRNKLGIGTSPGAPLHISYADGAYNDVQGFINECTNNRSTTIKHLDDPSG